MFAFRNVVLSGPKLQLAIGLSVALGAFLGAAVMFVVKGDQATGELVPFGSTTSFESVSSRPVCNEHYHFCIARNESGELIALYTYDTHPLFREHGCPAPWRSDFVFTDPITQDERAGWFRSGCSGTTYDVHGERVFGPGQRDMDRFPIVIDSDRVLVDTRHLICGIGKPAECRKAPRAD